MGSARVVKTLMGGQAFYADIKGGMVITHRGMVYVKMFYGGMVLFL